jgi:hypothetical protein
MVLKRIGVLSAGKILALLYACLGFIAGCFISIFATLGLFASLADKNLPGPFVAAFLGLGALIFMPVLYGSLGFLLGVIGSSIYNGLAKLIGGIELDLQ